jgi:hypothetical protein
MGTYWICETQCRVVSRLATYYEGYPNPISWQTTNLSPVDADTFICSVPIKSNTVDETGTYPYTPIDEGFDLYRLEFCNDKTHLATSVQSEALLSGGVPALYDGQHLSEYGFHFGPLLNDSVTENTTSGSLSPETYYQWVAIYTWLDSQGVRHQSWPSNTASLTTSDAGGPIKATLTVWNLTLSEHCDPEDATQPVMIEIYRAGGTSDGFYHLEQIVTNDPTLPTQEITSTMADSDLQSKEILYRDGGVLEDTSLPACKHIVANGDRVWLISCDDPEFLWHSKINGRDQVLPGFNTDFIQRTEIGAGCTALASLDDKLIVFKANRVITYVGNPPNNQGVGGNLNGPILVSVATGCIDPRSVTNCPAGVVFQATDSIYVLTRGMEVQKIGGPVEDELAAYPVVTSAVHAESLDLVLFTLTNTTGTLGVTLAWHYQINEWTVWHTQDSRSTPRVGAITGAMCSRGGVPRYHQGQPETPVLWLDPSNYADHDGTARSFTALTPWFQFAQVQGFQKIRRVTLLGAYQNVHSLAFKVYYDFDTTTYTSFSLTYAQVTALLKGTREQVQLHLGRKCESFRLEVTATKAGTGTGKLVRWESLLLELGGKSGTFRLPVEARR